MLKKTRMLSLLTAMSLLAVTWPLFGAEDGGAGAAPVHPAGFFERNSVLTEIIAVPILMILLAGAMASDRTTETIETRTSDIFNKPLLKSYTTVNVPKEPSSPDEIRNALVVFIVLYVILRFTCLFGFFNLFYKFIGGFIDIFCS